MQICLETLVSLFYERPEELGQFEEVAADELPGDARKLLAHDNHMTVTVEQVHRSLVDVRVLQTHSDADHYAREILLSRQSDGRVVQYGIMRIDLNYVGEQVRREIEQKQTPLGRILIQHNVLREVQLQSLWKVTPSQRLAGLLQCALPRTVYGRTALIYCNGEPAIELLEIVAPVEKDQAQSL